MESKTAENLIFKGNKKNQKLFFSKKNLLHYSRDDVLTQPQAFNVLFMFWRGSCVCLGCLRTISWLAIMNNVLVRAMIEYLQSIYFGGIQILCKRNYEIKKHWFWIFHEISEKIFIWKRNYLNKISHFFKLHRDWNNLIKKSLWIIPTPIIFVSSFYIA